MMSESDESQLSLWKSQLSNVNLVHFPKCKELKDTANAESVLGFAKYESYLQLLSRV